MEWIGVHCIKPSARNVSNYLVTPLNIILRNYDTRKNARLLIETYHLFNGTTVTDASHTEHNVFHNTLLIYPYHMKAIAQNNLSKIMAASVRGLYTHIWAWYYKLVTSCDHVILESNYSSMQYDERWLRFAAFENKAWVWNYIRHKTTVLITVLCFNPGQCVLVQLVYDVHM